MVTPLQIDGYERDMWGEFDALAIAQLAPVAYDPCYKPKIIVGLNTEAQLVPGLGYSSAAVRFRVGSLIYGFYMPASAVPAFNFQIADLSLDLPLFSEPVSNLFLQNPHQTANYPYLLCAPYPVVGSGLFSIEIWNQTGSPLTIIPLVGTLEPQ